MSYVLINSTIGRRIWYWPGPADLLAETKMHVIPSSAASPALQPMDAGIIYVHSDTCVNLQVTDHMGGIWFREKVRILQEGENDCALDAAGVAQWMHYQVGQAAAQAKAASPERDTSTHATALSETEWRKQQNSQADAPRTVMPECINLFYAGEYDNETPEAARERRYAAACLARNSWRSGWLGGWAAHGGSTITIPPEPPFSVGREPTA